MSDVTQTEMSDKPVLFGLADPLPDEGKVAGYIKVPYSSNASAFGVSAIPMVVVANGDGPTALFIGGSHGDEYEGQIALSRLVRELQPGDIKGRIIILPAANPPASRASQRHSPIDGLNLNRSYPGDLFGTPTSIAAYYIERNLMSEADIVVDLHGGGSSFSALPCASFVDHADPVERSRRLALALAFGAPTVLVANGYQERNSSGAAKRAGATRIGTEIGGGSGVEAHLVEMMVDGLTNVLRWSGILTDVPYRRRDEDTAIYEIVPERDYLYGLADGLFEPRANPGDIVSEGALAGLLHDASSPWSRPSEVRFQASGKIFARRAPCLTAKGDCLFQLASGFVERFPGEVGKALASNWVEDLYQRRRPRVSRSRKKQV